MKNYIYLNYGIKIDKIFVKGKEKYFFYNNTKYYIVENIKDINFVDNLFNLTNRLYYNNLTINTFILNNENKYLTNKDGNNICILKVNNIESNYTLDYINKFENFNCNLDDYDIVNEWKKTVDNLEKEMIEYNKEFPIIQNSINYFIGMAENAISLLNNYKKEIINNNNSIGHKIKLTNTNLDNPFNFIKTNRMYDLSNYIQYKFYTNKNDYDEIEKMIKSIRNEYEAIFLFSNLLFPKFYFDMVVDILNNIVNEEKLNVFINNIKNYKELLIYIQNRLKNVKEIQLISWISE